MSSRPLRPERGRARPRHRRAAFGLAPDAGRGNGRCRPARVLPLLLAVLCVLTFQARGGAQSIQVPFSVQAGLIAKVASFDRRFSARAGNKAIVLVVAMPHAPESERAALELKSALSQLPTVGDLPHEEQIVTYSGAAALSEVVKAKRAAIVYIGPGFDKETAPLREALANVNVLTVGALPEYVPEGLVLGFDLVSGRPKLLVNLAQARRQNVEFPASVLKLMKVFP